MAKVDNPTIPSSGISAPKRYVTIPDIDMFDYPHPAIRINGTNYGPGIHYLDAELAGTVQERLDAYTRGNIRLLQPTRDQKAERQVNVQGTGAGAGIATTSF